MSDIDPTLPTSAQAGSLEKRRVIAARYQAGLPLWHPDDDSSMLLDHDDDVERAVELGVIPTSPCGIIRAVNDVRNRSNE